MTLNPITGHRYRPTVRRTGTRTLIRRLPTTNPTTPILATDFPLQNNMKKPEFNGPRTLDEARKRIAELEAKVGGKPSTPSTVEPANAYASLKKPSRKAWDDATDKLVSVQAPGAIMALEAIQSALDAVSTPQEAVKLLAGHAESYKAQIAKVKQGSKEQYSLYRALQRIEKRQAYALLEAGPEVLRKAAFRNVEKL
jgi:hypothetical protein